MGWVSFYLFNFSFICVPAFIAPLSFHCPFYLFQNTFLTVFLEVYLDVFLEGKASKVLAVTLATSFSISFRFHIIEARINRPLHQRVLSYFSCLLTVSSLLTVMMCILGRNWLWLSPYWTSPGSSAKPRKCKDNGII